MIRFRHFGTLFRMKSFLGWEWRTNQRYSFNGDTVHEIPEVSKYPKFVYRLRQVINEKLKMFYFTCLVKIFDSKMTLKTWRSLTCYPCDIKKVTQGHSRMRSDHYSKSSSSKPKSDAIFRMKSLIRKKTTT